MLLRKPTTKAYHLSVRSDMRLYCSTKWNANFTYTSETCEVAYELTKVGMVL